ncbi:MAG TPA: ferritin [Actinomycetota bacterium]|nr:ferritin [Actinomycetota bacterium]
MLSKGLQEAMNKHLNKELYSAYTYLAMGAYFEDANFPGFAAWMKEQASEEYVHAMKFWEHIYDTGGSVTLLAIDAPRTEYTSPLDAFQQALASEKEVTTAIHDLYGHAVEEKDYPSQVFLQWFITEQVEEEKMATQIVEQLRMAGDSPATLLLIDREMGSRGGAPAA